MIILDTNVLSELMKPADLCSAAVTHWMKKQRTDDVFTTTMTLAEILAGIYYLQDKDRRKKPLLTIAGQIFSQLFSGRVLPFDDAAAHMFADIVTERRKRGLHYAPLDIQIAAVAKARGMAVATRNTSAFEESGIDVIDPWSS